MTQRELTLDLLRISGQMGVNSYDLTYKYSIKQAPTRIRELKQEGHTIVSRKNRDRSVTYILFKEKPLESNPRAKSSGSDYVVGLDGVARLKEDIKPEQLTLQ